jgi:hypothetical protein
MGGLQSGWHRPSAPIVERCEKIDLADLKQYSATYAKTRPAATRILRYVGDILEGNRPASADRPKRLIARADATVLAVERQRRAVV